MFRSTGTFTRNVAALGAVRLLGLIAGLVTSVMIARLLGPEDRGVYALTILAPSLIVLLAGLGVGPSLVYHVAQGEFPRQMILGNSTILSLAIGAGGGILGLGFIVFWQERILPGVPQRYLLFVLPLIPASLLASNLQQIFLGLERFRQLNLFSIVYTIASVLLLGMLLWRFNAGAPGAIGARVITVLASAVGLFFWVRRILGGVSWRLNRPYLKAATKFGLQAHLANVVQFLNYRLDLLLVNAFISPAAVGFYAIAAEVAERLWLLSGAASTALYPRIVAESDESVRANFTAIVSRNVLWFSAAGGTIAYGLSQWIVILLYSTEYLPAVRPLQILLPGVVALAASRMLSHDIAGRGRPILNSYVSVAGLAVNVVLNLALIPKYGVGGAAWATTASYTTMWGLTLAFYCSLSRNTLWSVTLLRRSDMAMWGQLAATTMRWARKRAKLSGEAALP